MRLAVTVGLILTLAGAPAWAEVTTRAVPYEHDGVELEGFLAAPMDATAENPRPGVLVIHEWWGLGEFARSRAEALAELGYVAFAVDMYGQGKLTDDPGQAAAWAGALYGDRSALRARGAAGLAVLLSQHGVDTDRIAVIGYCFGGTTALELAYAGEPIHAAVSFHGNPMPLREGDAPTAELLILHGAVDPLVSDESLREALDSLEEARATYSFIAYSGAVHSFTNPGADARGIEGAAYQRRADERSWRDMKSFFDAVFFPDR
jgi:dienelactone hydrolase